MLRARLYRGNASGLLAHERLLTVRQPYPGAFRKQRGFANIPTILLPPVVFGGLLIALWSWKCVMMVVFQNKIIYMPGLPPNARAERIEDYKNQCSGIQWHEETIRAIDGTRLSLCVASVNQQVNSSRVSKPVYILYFQGNASSLPPRLPFLSPVLRMLKEYHPISSEPTKYVMVCCSYRGYWNSKGRPSERGIAKDAAAALAWIGHHRESDIKIPIIIWGQSIGAGVATNLAARQELFAGKFVLQSLILETPFLSIRAMLETLYPQRWLPYRYLWPFLRNHLDSWQALGYLKQSTMQFGLKPPVVLFLEAGNDELVPKEHGDALVRRCTEIGLDHQRIVVGRALHTDVLAYPEGRRVVVEAIQQATERRQ